MGWGDWVVNACEQVQGGGGVLTVCSRWEGRAGGGGIGGVAGGNGFEGVVWVPPNPFPSDGGVVADLAICCCLLSFGR